MLTEPDFSEPCPANLPEEEEFRIGATRVAEVRRWGMVLVWASLVAVGPLILFSTGFGWFDAFGYFIWPLVFLLVVMIVSDRVSRHGWCWHCGDQLTDEIDAVCEFGHCPHCGVRMLQGVADSEEP